MAVPLCRCRVLYIGSAVPTITKDGLQGIQQPLRERYPVPAETSTTRGIDSWLSVWSNGLLLEYIEGDKKTESAFFPIQTLHYCAAVRYVNVSGYAVEGGGERFLPLDSPFAHLPDSPHPPIFAAMLRRTTGVKVLECHAFICTNDKAANALVRCCFHSYADSIYLKMDERVQGAQRAIEAPDEENHVATGESNTAGEGGGRSPPRSEGSLSLGSERRAGVANPNEPSSADWARRQQSGEYDALSLHSDNEPPSHHQSVGGGGGELVLRTQPQQTAAALQPDSGAPPSPSLSQQLAPPPFRHPSALLSTLHPHSLPPHPHHPIFFGPPPPPHPAFLRPPPFPPFAVPPPPAAFFATSSRRRGGGAAAAPVPVPAPPFIGAGKGGGWFPPPPPPFWLPPPPHHHLQQQHPPIRPYSPHEGGPIVTVPPESVYYGTTPRRTTVEEPAWLGSGAGSVRSPPDASYHPGSFPHELYADTLFRAREPSRADQPKSSSSLGVGLEHWESHEAAIHRRPHLNERAFASTMRMQSGAESTRGGGPIIEPLYSHTTPRSTRSATATGRRPGTPPIDYDAFDKLRIDTKQQQQQSNANSATNANGSAAIVY